MRTSRSSRSSSSNNSNSNSNSSPAWDVSAIENVGYIRPRPPRRPTRESSSSSNNSQSATDSGHHGGILSSLGLSSPTIQVTLAEDMLYLHPSPTPPQSFDQQQDDNSYSDPAQHPPTHDPMVRGTVVLWLPKPRTIKQLTVRCMAHQTIAWPNRPHEMSSPLDKSVHLIGTESGAGTDAYGVNGSNAGTHDDHSDDTPGHGLFLEKGQHTFSFSIIIPSSSATSERCPYGRIRQSVWAEAKGIGGILGGEVKSKEVPFYLVTNPGGAGASSPPPPLHLRVDGEHDELGSFSIALQSQHIMVGGLILLRLLLSSNPRPLKILSIKLRIRQTFSLRQPLQTSNSAPSPAPVTDYREIGTISHLHPPNFGNVRNNSRPPPPPPEDDDSNGLFIPLAKLEPGEAFNVHHLMRLPNDNLLRPSTQPGTDTAIGVEHKLLLEVFYKSFGESGGEGIEGAQTEGDGWGEMKRWRCEKGVDFYSCCCFLDSLTLPVYSLRDPHPDAEPVAPDCVCALKLSKMIELQGKVLMRETEELGFELDASSKEEEDYRRVGDLM
ncbi:hypothetical protein T439DRAFT_382626 [Meredithblackwellia eburnea MCA 4105]